MRLVQPRPAWVMLVLESVGELVIVKLREGGAAAAQGSRLRGS
jgi:hypothetical protein